MRPGRQRGFTKFELVVCILVIVVVASALYSRYMSLVVDAERAAVRGVVGWLQSGVNMRMSLAVTSGDVASLGQLAGSNPMVLAAKVMAPPSNYLGELQGEDAQQAPRGHWYFDGDRGVLVYRWRYRKAAEGFIQATDERLGFRLKVSATAADNPRRAEVGGLVLEAVDTQLWLRAKRQGLR